MGHERHRIHLISLHRSAGRFFKPQLESVKLATTDSAE